MSDKNLPDIFNPGSSPQTSAKRSVFGALARTMERLKERDIALAQAKEEAALALVERRFTPHRCAVSGARSLREWRKQPGQSLFTRYGDATLVPTASSHHDGPGRAADLSGFITAEFDWTAFPCAGCGASQLWVICRCGALVCSGKTVFAEGEQPHFSCDASCGQSFRVIGVAKEVPGETAPRPQAPKVGARAPVVLPQSKASAALPAPEGARRLSGPSTRKP